MKDNIYIETDEAGTIRHYKNGAFHREEGPAVIFPLGEKTWYKNGKLHRVGGPARTYGNGDMEWYQHGYLHRIGGPAREWTCLKQWFIHGKPHREDGPASFNINKNNEMVCLEFWLNGERIPSQEKLEQLVKLKSFW